jgi:MoxR-like ATPase
MLFGPPGTAKSLLTRTFANALAVPKEQYFENLCHAYTVPEELFGPLNLQKLENSIYERKIDGYLPTARVAYLDELMNMNQTQLNPLNTILQEKEFDNGTQGRVKVPLELVVGASNVYPQGDVAVEALYDRFLLRFWTDYINTRGEMFSLLIKEEEPSCKARLEDGDTFMLRSAARAVTIPNEVVEAILDIRGDLATKKGMYCSDRRWRSMLKLVRAHAALNGRSTAVLRDVLVIADSIWNHHDERADVLEIVSERACPSLGHARRFFTFAVHEFSHTSLTERDARGVSTARSTREKCAASLNDALTEIVGLPGSKEDPEIVEMTQKIMNMKRELGLAMARLDHRLGSLSK